MATVSVSCPECHAILKTTAATGARVRCPGCRTISPVPDAEAGVSGSVQVERPASRPSRDVEGIPASSGSEVPSEDLEGALLVSDTGDGDNDAGRKEEEPQRRARPRARAREKDDASRKPLVLKILL